MLSLKSHNYLFQTRKIFLLVNNSFIKSGILKNYLITDKQFNTANVTTMRVPQNDCAIIYFGLTCRSYYIVEIVDTNYLTKL